MTEHLVLFQMKQLPENLKQEVLDFIGYIFSKYQLTAAKPQPPHKKRFGKYRGCLKTGLSLHEIDAQLNQIRNEWERPIF